MGVPYLEASVSTRALQIRDYILGVLRDAGPGGVQSASVHADLMQAISAGNRPAIVVDMGNEDTPVREYGNRIRTISIGVRLLADGADPFAVIDPIREAAHAAVMDDKTLGGLAEEIEEGASNRQRVDLDVQIGSLVTTYSVRYITSGEALA